MKELIQTRPKFDELRKNLDRLDKFSLDTETNGKFGIFDVGMVGISLGWEDYAAYIPLAHLKGRQLPFDLVIDGLKPFVEDPSKSIIYHNAKFDEMVIGLYGLDPQGFLYDTVVMQHLFNENVPTKKLKALVLSYFDYQMRTYEEVIDAQPIKRGQKRDYSFANVPLDQALEYAADDAYWTYKLCTLLEKGLKTEAVWDCYKYIESPLSRVVRDMETRGVTLDREEVTKADEHFPQLMEEIKAEIFKEAGEVFNPGSSHQLGPILFEKFKISENPPKTKSGLYQTDAKVLKLYASRYPIVEQVLKYRKVKKVHSSFVKGLEKHIQKDGRVHANFNQVGTDTGRFSSDKPNLQNQKGDDEDDDISIRGFFVAPEDHKLIIADYSQVELRLLAHFSKDESMMEVFLTGRKLHDETAKKMLKMQGKGLREDEDTEERAAWWSRQKFYAKSLNFGIPYGRQDASVAEMLGVKRRCSHWPTWNRKKRMWEYLDPETEEVVDQGPPCHNCGKCFIRDWYDAFPNIEPYKEYVLNSARKTGYVRTLSGRKRRILDINSKDFGKRSHAERQAFNTKIQGSAGDLIKLAMVSLSPELKRFNAGILMTVHDELVVEAPSRYAEDVADMMKDKMEKPFQGKNPITVPLVVEPSICNRWSEGK